MKTGFKASWALAWSVPLPVRDRLPAPCPLAPWEHWLPCPLTNLAHLGTFPVSLHLRPDSGNFLLWEVGVSYLIGTLIHA